MPFDGRVSLLQDEESPESYVTCEPLAYTGSDGDTWTVPAGFHTDLASVPRYLTWFVARNGAYSKAAILHDWMCVEAHHGDMSRAVADNIFSKALGELGISRVKRRLMWAGVRAASRWCDATTAEMVRLAGWSALGLALVGPPALVVLAWSTVMDLASALIWRRSNGR